SWTGTVNYGCGSGSRPRGVDRARKIITLNHPYPPGGTYTGTLTVRAQSRQSGTQTPRFNVPAPQPPVPDPRPYTPSGWSGPLVVATQTGSITSAAAVTTADNAYVSWAGINQSLATIRTAFQVK